MPSVYEALDSIPTNTKKNFFFSKFSCYQAFNCKYTILFSDKFGCFYTSYQKTSSLRVSLSSFTQYNIMFLSSSHRSPQCVFTFSFIPTITKCLYHVPGIETQGPERYSRKQIKIQARGRRKIQKEEINIYSIPPQPQFQL